MIMAMKTTMRGANELNLGSSFIFFLRYSGKVF